MFSRYDSQSNSVFQLGHNYNEILDDRYYRVREQEYGYNSCRYCHSHHRSDSDKCYFNCKYCHSIHLKQDIYKTNAISNQLLCPYLVAQCMLEQEKKSFICDQCEGEGKIQKITTVKYCQPQRHYQKRCKQFRQMLKEKVEEIKETNIVIPTRKIFKTNEVSQIQECYQCKGKGRVYKVIQCCDRGCIECKYTKIKINPLWRQLRLKGEDNDEIFPCRICSQQVAIGSKIFKLSCGHVFHQKCILQWLVKSNQRCYLCQQVDPYLQSEDIATRLKNEFQPICLDWVNQPHVGLGKMANKMADKIADKIADQIADKIADQIADKVADQIADKMADQMADKMADQISDQIADQNLGGPLERSDIDMSDYEKISAKSQGSSQNSGSGSSSLDMASSQAGTIKSNVLVQAKLAQQNGGPENDEENNTLMIQNILKKLQLEGSDSDWETVSEKTCSRDEKSSNEQEEIQPAFNNFE